MHYISSGIVVHIEGRKVLTVSNDTIALQVSYAIYTISYQTVSSKSPFKMAGTETTQCAVMHRGMWWWFYKLSPQLICNAKQKTILEFFFNVIHVHSPTDPFRKGLYFCMDNQKKNY